jgi:hypothetical protein
MALLATSSTLEFAWVNALQNGSGLGRLEFQVHSIAWQSGWRHVLPACESAFDILYKRKLIQDSGLRPGERDIVEKMLNDLTNRRGREAWGSP